MQANELVVSDQLSFVWMYRYKTWKFEHKKRRESFLEETSRAQAKEMYKTNQTQRKRSKAFYTDGIKRKEEATEKWEGLPARTDGLLVKADNKEGQWFARMFWWLVIGLLSFKTHCCHRPNLQTILHSCARVRVQCQCFRAFSAWSLRFSQTRESYHWLSSFKKRFWLRRSPFVEAKWGWAICTGGRQGLDLCRDPSVFVFRVCICVVVERTGQVLTATWKCRLTFLHFMYMTVRRITDHTTEPLNWGPDLEDCLLDSVRKDFGPVQGPV